jgi:hypothetical protein
MPSYTNAWSNVVPAGSDPANTADDHMRRIRLDLFERLSDIVQDWTADPVLLDLTKGNVINGHRGWVSVVVLSTTTGTGSATAETTLKTVTLPGNSLGVGGGIRVEVYGRFTVAASGVRVYRLYVGGTLLHSFASWPDGAFWNRALVFNRGTATAQTAHSRAESLTGYSLIRTTLGIDTTQNVEIKVTGETQDAADDVEVDLFTVDRMKVG